MSDDRIITTKLFYDNDELNKFDIDNYNIYYSHKLISYYEHLINLLYKKLKIYKHYYENGLVVEKESKDKKVNINDINNTLIFYKRKLKYSKELIGKIEPLIKILNPDYISTSSKSISTYFLYFNKDINNIIKLLNNLEIEYDNKYQNNLITNELVKIRFSNHDYIKDELNNEFVNDDLFIDIRIKNLLDNY